MNHTTNQTRLEMNKVPLVNILLSVKNIFDAWLSFQRKGIM